MSGPAGPASGSDRLAPLVPVLERARSLGFLGPGPVEEHIGHAQVFDRAIEAIGYQGGELADIGSGGGVPGLVLLVGRPDWRGVLIDAAQKRCSFLVWAVAELGLDDRVEVWRGRAEELGRQSRARERFDVVVARGFGPPSTTVECATPLARTDGWVVISEPPEGRSWPADGLAQLGLEEDRSQPGVALFRRCSSLPDRFPRTAKQQQRKPLFDVE